MKHILLLLITMMMTAQLFAQKTKTANEPVMTQQAPPGTDVNAAMKDQYEKMYALAVRYGDYSAASNAVYGLLAMDTASLALKDTLAALMFARGALDQCLKLATQVYAAQPSNLRMLELLAVSEQGLGKAKESLDYYEKLYPQTNSLFHLYQIATLQFGLERLGECQANLEKIIADETAEKETVAINVGQGYQQQVPFKAAALNIRGVILRGLNNSEDAKKSFEDALKVYPDFVLAKGNLDDMNKPKDDKEPPKK